MQVGEQSAEAIVAGIAGESRQERRAEGSEYGAREGTHTMVERSLRLQGVTTAVATLWGTGGQKRCSRGGPTWAMERPGCGEPSDGERCTSN